MKLAYSLYLFAVVFSGGCSEDRAGQSAASGDDGRPVGTTASSNSATHEDAKATIDEWLGVYSSPSEIGGFTGTVLSISNNLSDGLRYRKRFYTDVISPDDIEQDESTGSCLIEGNRIYIPEAFGFYHKDKLQLDAAISLYTKVTVNGHITLMRDDAYAAFKAGQKLYDYGILIKVSAKNDLLFDLDTVQRKSITVLYSDPTKRWQDPFVHGPNER